MPTEAEETDLPQESCCDHHSDVPECQCSELELPDGGSTGDDSTERPKQVRLVFGVLAAKCKGLSTLWALAGGFYMPTSAVCLAIRLDQAGFLPEVAEHSKCSSYTSLFRPPED
jgi:hypothetical protein